MSKIKKEKGVKKERVVTHCNLQPATCNLQPATCNYGGNDGYATLYFAEGNYKVLIFKRITFISKSL